MKIVICSSALPEKIENRIPSASPASGKYLRNMASAFKKNGLEVEFLSYIALPEAAEAIENYKKEQNIENTKGYLSDIQRNVYRYVLKDKTIVLSVISFKNLVKKCVQTGDIVIFYNVAYFDVGLVRDFSKKGINCILILADYTTPSEYINPIRRYFARREEWEMHRFQYAVLLSSAAEKLVSISCKSEIIEGGLCISDYNSIVPPNKTGKKLSCLFAGTLEPVTGIDRLIEAFESAQIESNLIICGKGSMDKEIRKAAEKNPRIVFKGYVSNEEYINILNSAQVLINPRNMDRPENQNNFPSKTLEYLASGRYTISTKFAGWERFENNFEFYDNSIEELAAILKNAELYPDEKLKSYYEKNRKKAKEFDWNTQVRRILKMVE